MKIKQDEPQFTPITITLETREEAEALWDALRVERGDPVPCRPQSYRTFYTNLSDWLANESRL